MVSYTGDNSKSSPLSSLNCDLHCSQSRSVCRAQQSHNSPAQSGNWSSAPTHTADLLQHPKVFFMQWKRWSGTQVITVQLWRAMVAPMEKFVFFCLFHTPFLYLPLHASHYLLCPVCIHFHTHRESCWLLQEIKISFEQFCWPDSPKHIFGLCSLASRCVLCNEGAGIWGNVMRLSRGYHSRITFQIDVFSLCMWERCEELGQ